MSDFEAYSKELLQSSKLFLIEAKSSNIGTSSGQRLLRASLTHAFFFLESEINYLSGHFKGNRDFDLNERSLLSEKEVQLRKGEFVITDRDKYFRLEDRIEFLIVRFSGSRDLLSGAWYSELMLAIKLRNMLVHPREVRSLTVKGVEEALSSIIYCLSALYQAIFQKEFPLKSLGLDTGPLN